MIPSKTWFPQSLQERAAWYENFNFQAQSTGASLGLTVDDLTQINEDNMMMQFLASTAVTFETFNESFTLFRNLVTTGDIGDTPPPFPAFPSPGIPLISPVVGIFERVSEVYRPRIMASAAYTDEQGALYGLIGAGPEPPDPATVEPTLKTFPAATGNMFSAVVTGRAQADQWVISYAEVGTTNWIVAGTFTGKSGDITVPNTTGKPIQLQVRIQLRKGNANYGQPSAIILTTVNP
ncbi:MAG: hypothetical protein IPL32_16720 [Chloracidobacterium sp.]|nr:hypothetical protein [Chloracidobacterium sp.]